MNGGAKDTYMPTVTAPNSLKVVAVLASHYTRLSA
jgi:hypothetical protein